MSDKKKKKTYKEINGTTRVGDFLRKIGRSDVLEKIIGVAGEVVTGDFVGALEKVLIEDDKISAENAKRALELAHFDAMEQQEITKRWQSDMMSDSWASKNIRPYTLGFLTAFTAILSVLDSAVSGFTVRNEWIDILSYLLSIVFVAYFGSRGLEKITDKVAQIKLNK